MEAVLEEVKQWDFVDADSIYLMGNSQGGLVTALTASEHREEIRAVILIYPAFCIYDDVHEMFDSPEEIPETMNKFYRGKNVKDSDIDGSGLGLYIASVLMAKMNGELICSSKGKGLTVTLMILLS